MRGKRIAIVVNGLSGGGAERVAALLANGLYSKGYDVLFIAAFSAEKEYPLSDGVHYVYIDPKAEGKIGKYVNRTVKIYQTLKEYKPDAIISFIIIEMLLSNFLKVAPIVYSLRIAPSSLVHKKKRWLSCLYSYKRAKKIVFQTEDAKNFFDEPIREKGVVIPNPLSENLPYWNKESHEKTVLTACRLTAQKNLPMLIEGFSRFHEKFPDYTLKIYGQDEDGITNELLKLCKDLQISDAVSILPHTKNIHQIMQNSAVFALTSNFEGLSNSMLEALAIGIPTVCTDCPPGGARTFIEDGVNGMLIPVGDGDELYRRLCLLAENEQLGHTMSEKSVKIRQELALEKIVDAWDDLIADAIFQSEKS